MLTLIPGAPFGCEERRQALQGRLRDHAVGDEASGTWAKVFVKVKRRGFLTLGIAVGGFP